MRHVKGEGGKLFQEGKRKRGAAMTGDSIRTAGRKAGKHVPARAAARAGAKSNAQA